MSNAATTANHLPVIKGVTYFLAHVPSMVRHGSKPSREVTHDPSLLGKLVDHLETFEDAVGYPPNQVFIGNLDPDDLHPIPTPWYKHPVPNASRQGPFGELMPEEEFYGIMALCDEFDILLLETSFVEDVIRRLSTHPLVQPKVIDKLKKKGVPLLTKLAKEAEGMASRRPSPQLPRAPSPCLCLPSCTKRC